MQACNVFLDKTTEQLHKVLQERSPLSWKNAPTEDLVNLARTYSHLKWLIEKCNTEALAEIEALSTILNAHSEELDYTVSDLIASESSAPTDNKSDHDKLRAQLKEHYARNPLASQVEALQEEQLSPNVIIRRVSDQQGKLKIIFKIPCSVKLGNSIKNSKSKATIGPGDAVADLELMKDADAKTNPQQNLRSRSQSLEPASLKKIVQTKKKKNANWSVSKSKRSMRGAGAQDRANSSTLPIETFDEEPEPTYCFCNQPSSGDMIACDNRKCPNGEWFHYKCVGLLNRVEALKYTKQKWYCKDSCKIQSEEDARIKKQKGLKRNRKRW